MDVLLHTSLSGETIHRIRQILAAKGQTLESVFEKAVEPYFSLVSAQPACAESNQAANLLEGLAQLPKIQLQGDDFPSSAEEDKIWLERALIEKHGKGIS